MSDQYRMARYFALFILLVAITSCSYMKNSESFLGRLGRHLASVESLDSQMASIRSIVNEINTNGKKVINLYAYPKAKVSVFDGNDRVKTLLAKMKAAQKELLYQTSVNDINSPDGQKVLLMVVDYLQAVVTINKIYVQIAHLPVVNGVANSSAAYDWKNLDQYNLKIDKDFALMLLSKINFLARHMSEQEIKNLGLSTAQVGKAIEIKLGGEIRQLLEHLAISDPNSVNEYGLFIKFNALKETMINAWGINRLYKDPYSGMAIQDNRAKDILTFRPGEDKTLATADYYEELMQSDNYYNVFSLEIQKVVEASKSSKTVSMSLGTEAEYEELYRNLIWGYPENEASKIIKPFPHLKDYYLGSGKYNGYTPYSKTDVSFKFPGTEVRDTEEYDFNGDPLDLKPTKGHVINYGKYPHLYYSVFAGDELTPENISTKMANDAYQFRSEAIIQHMAYRIVDEEFNEDMKAKLLVHLRSLIDAKFKERYKNYFSSVTKPLLDKHLAYSNLVQRKVNDKYASLKKSLAATEGIKSTFIHYYITELNKLPKSATLHPRTPEILIAMIKDALEKGYHDDIIFSLEDPAIGDVVKKFYSDFSDAFYKSVNGSETFEQMTQILWDKLNETAYAYYKKYPYTFDQEMMYDIRKENVMPQDNTYVDPRVKYIIIDHSKTPAGKKAATLSKVATKTVVPKKAPTTTPKPITFDDKLQNLMLTFQPFIQGQDLNDMKKKGSNMKNIEIIDVRRDQYKAKVKLPTANITLYKLFSFIGMYPSGFSNAIKTKNSAFYNKLGYKFVSKGEDRQRFLAEQNIGLLKMSAPLVQNVIFYQQIKHSHINGKSETITYTYEDVYKPAIFVMAMKAYNEVTDTIDQKMVGSYIGEAMTASRKALKGQAHGDSPATPFNEGLFETFAQADPTDPKNNKRFQFMYDQLEELRGIIMGANGNSAQAQKFQKFDQSLFASIHPYKYFYEKYVAPVINIVIAVIMVISIVVGFIFPPAGIPGWLAASLLVFEVSAFSYIMADNIGYRIVYQRMIEIPATLKMQGHLAAISSVGESPLQLMYKKGAEDQANTYKINSSLDSWDRITASEKANIEERKSLIYERLMWLPLDLMWGASIVKQFRTFTGLSGMKALKKFNMPVLSFRQKTQMVFKTNNWEQVFKEKGLIRGVGAVTKDIVTGIPQMGKLLPKYQPYPKELLDKFGLRIGLNSKVVEIYESGKFTKEFSKIVSDAKYPLEGENLVFNQLFSEIKKFDAKQFSQFIEFQKTNEITILMEKIQASLDKGITPLELSEASAFAHTPKTVWGILFNGLFEKGRIKKLQSLLKPGIEPAEALNKYREAKALNNVTALNKVFDEVAVTGYNQELLIQVFDQAGLKTSMANSIKTIKNNYSVWKSLKTPEVVLTNDMLKLREALKNAKHIRSSALVDKVNSVEALLEKNPEFYKELNFSSVNDYWWSILDHSDLMMIEEISAAAKRGSVVRQFSLVFVDYKTIMETIRPLEWKVASDSRALRPLEQEATFKTDYEDIIVDEENIYPVGGFGDKKNPTIKLLEGKISDQIQ